VVDRVDTRSSHGVPVNLWFPACACGAQLSLGMGVRLSDRLVAMLMSHAHIAGLPGPAKMKRLHGVATANDLVHRKFHRLSPNELWVTDITEHPARRKFTVAR
jgi:hypothetical protein